MPTITIPGSVTIIGSGGFSGCSSLKAIRCEAGTPPEMLENTFYSKLYDEATLYVPGQNIDDYKMTFPWNLFQNVRSLEEIVVEDVTLDVTEAEITEGETLQLTAKILPENATDQTIIWSSSDDAIATVDEKGMVTAVKPGTATITATSSNGPKAEYTVTVVAKVIAVSGITLNVTEVDITEGESIRLTATIEPDDATDQTITWSSSDETIATVDEKGIVTAVKPGTATITVTTANGLKAECTVTVVAKVIEVNGITLDVTEADIVEGETLQLTATIEPEDATDQTITWSSSDDEVATVDENGLVTAVKPGTATITVTAANGIKAECTVTVIAKVIEVNGITLDVTEADIVEGETLQLTATIEPENATDQTITWSSSDETIATVDENGVVTAIKPGEAAITASTSNGLKAECKVTVVAKIISVDGLTLNMTEAEVLEGETLKLIATIEPENATDQTITWSSSDDEVATVDENGLVTAVKPGEATITASATNGLKAECKVTVTKRTSGINTIVVEGNSIIAPEGSEVYNMQGLRVNPEGLCSGFYIVRIAGQKAIKIRVD